MKCVDIDKARYMLTFQIFLLSVSMFGNSGGGMFGQPTSSSSGSLFGASSGFGSVSNPSSGLFGAGAAHASGGGLFGATPTPGGALFGASTTNPSAGGGLFGASTTTPPAGGGLFGASPTTPAAGGGMFGASSTTPLSGGGLFGASTTTPVAGGGLFGASTTTPSAGGGMFGASSTTPSSGGGLFGGSTATPSAGGGLFGSSATGAAGSLAGVRTGVLEHRKLDELLHSWDGRLNQQASLFAKFAENVVSVDNQLIHGQRTLKELGEEFGKIRASAQKIDLEISHVHAQQDALGKLLAQISVTLGGGNTGHTDNKAGVVGAQIDDLERALDGVVADLDKIITGTEGSGKNKISGLAKLLQLHQNSIDALSSQINDMRN